MELFYWSNILLFFNKIILEKTTPDKAKDRQLPSDAFNVSYIHEDKEFLDVTRSGKMANIFDFYYDKYGGVKSINYGFGTVNPSQWGYKKPEKKARKKR